MFDLMSGPLAPLKQAFVFCGWRAVPVDYLIDKSQDLADTTFQAKLHEDLKSAVFIAAALDCSACADAILEPARLLLLL